MTTAPACRASSRPPGAVPVGLGAPIGVLLRADLATQSRRARRAYQANRHHQASRPPPTTPIRPRLHKESTPREISRLVFGLPCGEARSGVKIGRGRPLTSLLLGPGEAGGSSDAGSRAVGPSVSP